MSSSCAFQDLLEAVFAVGVGLLQVIFLLVQIAHFLSESLALI